LQFFFLISFLSFFCVTEHGLSGKTMFRVDKNPVWSDAKRGLFYFPGNFNNRVFFRLKD
jgi:hypothetical protein